MVEYEQIICKDNQRLYDLPGKASLEISLFHGGYSFLDCRETAPVQDGCGIDQYIKVLP